MKDVDQNRLHKAMQNLLSYQLPNGEFKWLPSDQNGSGMATEQALLALLQFKDLENRFMTGQLNLLLKLI